MRVRFGLMIFGLVCVVAVAARGGEEADRHIRAIADQLRCPVCRGVPITESPAELAQDMMHMIRAKLAAGETDAQILQYFADRYGEWILLKPRAEGMNLLVWVLPLAIFVGGAGIVTLAVIRWSRKSKTP